MPTRISPERTHQILATDAAHLWHPYGPATPAPGRSPWLVTDAAGVRLRLTDGVREVSAIDAMASWWCTIHGYRHPVLDAAAAEQLGRFSHVMFGGLTHEPAVRLAEALLGLAPPDLSRIFLADSGSVAVEVALKIVRQAAAAQPGVQRTRIAALRGGYHGDTTGAMSLCDPDGSMHALWADSLPTQALLPRPPSRGRDDLVSDWLGEARAVLQSGRDELCAVIVEPLLQGAGGMHAWHPDALSGLAELCREFELLLIADEIATGLGRTGTLWACDAAGVVPDVLVVGKSLTGGYLTQAAVLTTEVIAARVDAGPGGALQHGPTFMGNPLASAISTASLGLLADGSWRADVARVSAALTAGLAPLTGTALVETRVLGATGVAELDRPVDVALATRIALEHGVWLRPFRNLVYAMPAYLMPDADVAQVCRAITAVVEAHGD